MSAFKNVGKQIGSSVGQIAKSKPVKIAVGTAALGGGLYVAGTAAGAGASNFVDSSGLGGLVTLFNPKATKEQKQGAGGLIGIFIAIVVVLLVVFLILPQIKKVMKK